MPLHLINPFSYEEFTHILDGTTADLCNTLALHEPLGWEAILDRYNYRGMARTAGETTRIAFHERLRNTDNIVDRLHLMNEISGWGHMPSIDDSLANSVNITLDALDDEENLTIEAIEGNRISTVSKIYEMWDPHYWVIYDSYFARGLQWLISQLWNINKQQTSRSILRFPFPQGRANSAIAGFPALGTDRQAALAFAYASWLARAIASELNYRYDVNHWSAFRVEMTLFQLGHEV